MTRDIAKALREKSYIVVIVPTLICAYGWNLHSPYLAPKTLRGAVALSGVHDAPCVIGGKRPKGKILGGVGIVFIVSSWAVRGSDGQKIF